MLGVGTHPYRRIANDTLIPKKTTASNLFFEPMNRQSRNGSFTNNNENNENDKRPRPQIQRPQQPQRPQPVFQNYQNQVNNFMNMFDGHDPFEHVHETGNPFNWATQTPEDMEQWFPEDKHIYSPVIPDVSDESELENILRNIESRNFTQEEEEEKEEEEKEESDYKQEEKEEEREVNFFYLPSLEKTQEGFDETTHLGEWNMTPPTSPTNDRKTADKIFTRTGGFVKEISNESNENEGQLETINARQLLTSGDILTKKSPNHTEIKGINIKRLQGLLTGVGAGREEKEEEEEEALKSSNQKYDESDYFGNKTQEEEEENRKTKLLKERLSDTEPEDHQVYLDYLEKMKQEGQLNMALSRNAFERETVMTRIELNSFRTLRNIKTAYKNYREYEDAHIGKRNVYNKNGNKKGFPIRISRTYFKTGKPSTGRDKATDELFKKKFEDATYSE
jgi:hypothetical protein